ncbi:MAG: ABC transporter ATP-binding protein [Succiniclasticum sp.]|nr:ABC transporter ATP-binding protein [Succiniclasticum sp.]
MTTPTLPMIEVENLSVVLNHKRIVHDISFTAEKGKITAIIGPNGCGKSTTLKAICRIHPIAAGSVRVLGRDVRDYGYREFARQLAILPQSPQAPADLTVRDLVAMGRFPYRRFFGKATAEDREFIDWALRETNLEAYQHRVLSTLSGGERQRAWIAMALAQNPKILLLDEPTTYLDISHQLEVLQLLYRLNEELGLTVVLVLHDLNQAMQFAHRVVVLQQGAFVTSGSPREIITVDLLRRVFGVVAEEAVGPSGQRALLPLDLVRHSRKGDEPVCSRPC